VIPVFADTSYWMALLNPRDELYPKAVAAYREHSSRGVVTSEMVLAEVLNGFSNRGRILRDAGARAVETIQRRADVTVIPQTSGQFEGALQFYKKVADKEWSLTDCASFLIMEERGIRAALTHDRHFAQAGFETVLR
jgi:uncharacterized protein